jgi:hypothetical protein
VSVKRERAFEWEQRSGSNKMEGVGEALVLDRYQKLTGPVRARGPWTLAGAIEDVFSATMSGGKG